MFKFIERLKQQPVPVVPTLRMNGNDYPADHPKAREVFGAMRDGAKRQVAIQTADRVTELLLERFVTADVTDEVDYVAKSKAAVTGLVRGIESLSLEGVGSGQEFVLARMAAVYSDDAPSTQHVFASIRNLLLE